MKKLLIALGALVLLIVAAAIIVPFVVPVDTYKNKVIVLVKAATGRDFRIDGPVKFSLLPVLGLEANDVAFANAAGAKSPDMARLKQLQIQLALFPLLHGSVEIARFVLVQPDIELEVDKTGQPNWVFAPAAKPAAPGAPKAAPGAASGASPAAFELALDDVQFTGGKISYVDDRTGKTQLIDSIDMKLSLPNLESRFTGDGSVMWNGEKVALSLAVAKPNLLLAGKESEVDISLAADPIKLGFKGKVSGLPSAKVAGAIDLAVPSIRNLAKWAGAPLPDGSGFGPLAIKGKLDMAGTKIAFSDADIALDAIKAKGAIEVETGGKRPALKGQLAVETLDVNPYLPPEKTAEPGNAAAATPAASGGAAPAAGWSDDPIDLSGLGLADADFDLSANAIRYRKIEIGKSVLGLHVKDAKLTADLSQLTLYEGKGTGKITMDGSAAVPAVTMNFDLSGVQIGPLLVALGNDRLTGVGKFDMAVTGSGRSQRALVSALNGKGSLNLADGKIKGINLISMAKNAATSLTGSSGGGSETDFGTLSATYTITKGIMKNDDLVIKSGTVPITGAGTADLPARTMDYRVTVSIAGAVGIPVKITGPWDNPNYRPDLGGALEGVVKTPGKLLEQVAPNGNPVDKLKGLFGR
jgi:AsmA protein